MLLKNWQILKEVVYLLKIPFNVTIEFQNKRLTLSDVYHRWTLMQLNLKECLTKKAYKTGLAEHLLNALIKRNECFFSIPLMCSALYLDPRFHMVITRDDEKTEIAKQNIITIGRRLENLRNKSAAQNQNADAGNNSTESLSFEFDEADAMLNFKIKRIQCNII